MSNRYPTTINKDKELNNKDICNAFGCSCKVTETIDVDAGKFGNIVLNLCSTCLKKFQ